MFSDRERQLMQDVVDNADRIAAHLADMDFAAFERDARTTDAVERCLQRLTEAVIQLGQEAAIRADPTLPWHHVRTLGNRLRHDYRRIEPEVIFRTATVQVPALGAAIAATLTTS
ncbi:HepT-like ribonuclease domain-containing protein [Sphingomonas bacterium]|uniref:HepT-like ribonuclease domain-containing protein n=1 Tax=Sphingomonas bacterium TaxID=1895847 RepID=UPI0015764187|nr:HepT-like ribonuclease domain-containing protein [Sphingomonas bacterium]